MDGLQVLEDTLRRVLNSLSAFADRRELFIFVLVFGSLLALLGLWCGRRFNGDRGGVFALECLGVLEAYHERSPRKTGEIIPLGIA